MTHHVFLSPHLDDVSLSCGGLISQLVNRQETVDIITIFAGLLPPNQPISDFAAYQHQMWGEPAQAYELRRREDQLALACFDLKPIWLDFLDCIYRGNLTQQKWYYNSDDDIFGNLHPDEYQIIGPILKRVSDHLAERDENEVIIYGPLTVGQHVDHQLAFLVALKFMLAGYAVFFYEEFPYTDRDPNFLTTALRQTTPALIQHLALAETGQFSATVTPRWHSEIRPLSAEDVNQKIAAIAAYQTQLDVLFGGEVAMAERVVAYASQVGQGNPAERLWFLTI